MLLAFAERLGIAETSRTFMVPLDLISRWARDARREEALNGAAEGEKAGGGALHHRGGSAYPRSASPQTFTSLPGRRDQHEVPKEPWRALTRVEKRARIEDLRAIFAETGSRPTTLCGVDARN